MNMRLTRLFPSWLMVFLIPWTLTTTPHARGAEQAAYVNVVGSWTADPALGQLGLIQVSYQFKADGQYIQRLDLKSFCDEYYGQNCEYFWMVFEGEYSVTRGVITLHPQIEKIVILHRGQANPVIQQKDQNTNARAEEFSIDVIHGNLILTNRINSRATTFKPEK